MHQYRTNGINLLRFKNTALRIQIVVQNFTTPYKSSYIVLQKSEPIFKPISMYSR